MPFCSVQSPVLASQKYDRSDKGRIQVSSPQTHKWHEWGFSTRIMLSNKLRMTFDHSCGEVMFLSRHLPHFICLFSCR